MSDQSKIPEEEKELFQHLKVDYKRSKDDVWAEMEKNIDASPSVQEETPVVRINWLRYAAVGIVLIAAGTLSFMRFYAVEVLTNKGEFLSHTLPDGSDVHLNANSSISYHPYWWTFNRELEMEGEAFFEVEKGEKFQVLSQNGKTEVLGTSFNIYARKDIYLVYCSTGKVRVTNKAGNATVITPGEMANANQNVVSKEEIAAEKAIPWRSNKFNYNNVKMSQVINDLENHYNITIERKENEIDELLFTGFFDRPENPEDALQVICSVFELSFEKTDTFTYSIH